MGHHPCSHIHLWYYLTNNLGKIYHHCSFWRSHGKSKIKDLIKMDSFIFCITTYLINMTYPACIPVVSLSILYSLLLFPAKISMNLFQIRSIILQGCEHVTESSIWVTLIYEKTYEKIHKIYGMMPTNLTVSPCNRLSILLWNHD